MPIEIIEPGLGSTIQDLGRPGYYRYGIPPGGAVDLYSARAANLLVGNDEGAALIESPYLGPKLRATEDTVIAVTGAQMELQVNGAGAPSWEAVPLSAGDVVSFGFLTAGARIYIAVAGGIDVPEVLGSRSTYAIGSFGGFEGRALLAGDVLPTGSGGARPGRSVPEDLRPSFSRSIEVRVVMGLYDYRLSEAGLRAFLDEEWTLSPVADRMGFRYSGPTLEWIEREQPFGAGSDPSNIVDAGYPVGSIQIPGGLEPIILHRDAVSGGGYAMVATVISADMDLVGQSSPGARTRFRAVSLDDALAARRERDDLVDALRAALS